MPSSKISISTETKVGFENINIEELLNSLNIKHKFNNSGIYVSTDTKFNIVETKLSELKYLITQKKITDKFGQLKVETNTNFSIDLININLLIHDFFENNKVDYIKNIELVYANKTEVSFKINSKIGITIPLVIDLPVTIDRFLILNFRIKNGVKIFVKLVNSILKFTTDKSIIRNDGNIRIDVRELTEIPAPILHIIDNWTSKLRGEIVFDKGLLKLDLLFKIDKNLSNK